MKGLVIWGIWRWTVWIDYGLHGVFEYRTACFMDQIGTHSCAIQWRSKAAKRGSKVQTMQYGVDTEHIYAGVYGIIAYTMNSSSSIM